MKFLLSMTLFMFFLSASLASALYVPPDPEMPARVQKCVDEIRTDLTDSVFMTDTTGDDPYKWFRDKYAFCLMLNCQYAAPLCPNDVSENEYYACVDEVDKRGDECIKNAPSVESIIAGTAQVKQDEVEKKECRQVTDVLATYGDEKYRSDCKDSTTLRTYVCIDLNAEPQPRDIDCTKIQYAPGEFYRGCSHPDGVVADCSIESQDRTLAELQYQLSGIQSFAELHRFVHRLTPGEFDLIQEHSAELGDYNSIMAAQQNIDSFRKALRATDKVSEYERQPPGTLEWWQLDVINEMRIERAEEAQIAEEREQLRREIARLDAENAAREAYLNSWKHTYDKGVAIGSAVGTSLWEQATWKTAWDHGGITNVMNSNLPFHKKVSAVMGPAAFTPLGSVAGTASLPSLMADPSIGRDWKILAGVMAALPGLDIPEVPYVSTAVTTFVGELPTTVGQEDFKYD